MNIHADISAIRDIAATIREMLGDDFDDQTFLDTLDGETDAMDLLGSMIRRRLEAKAQAEAMKQVAADYTARSKRFTAQAEAMTRGMGKLLDAIGETKVQHSLGTVSRTKPKPSLEITDANAVPTQLRKWEPDGAAIKASLDAGVDVPGARLIYGEPGLTVRVK